MPSMFQSLLHGFEDMFQDEVPKELPPIRGRFHFGVVIPTRPAYRASRGAHGEGLYMREFESMFTF